MKRHVTADLDPTEFGGRYTLLRRLAVGGMAEIYLARQAATAGFEKEVVIKRLRPELADDPRIVEMFLDEAKIGAQLNHPNIVHVYDVDELDGIPYIAMEYIIGEELNELCRRGLAIGKFLPLEHAVELIRQAAAGMGYFHAKRGGESGEQRGKALEIVHLDISPSNLLVTQDGFLKIIDFGIARAAGQSHRGDTMPGKLSYMSPEQATRGAVDHRSDLFSLGIVLYEITVGKRLFRGPANEVVEKLVNVKIEPPTFVRRNFPPALEAIVMRALEKHSGDRYQSAYDLADDLETFLRDERMHSGPVRIARYLDALTVAGGGPRRVELTTEHEDGGADDLDFDTGTFDGFTAGEGAPGPEQAPLWEDVEQPEAEIAAALQMDLADLRALRTPVPVRPTNLVDDDEPIATNPVRKVAREEVSGVRDIDIDETGESPLAEADAAADHEDDEPTRAASPLDPRGRPTPRPTPTPLPPPRPPTPTPFPAELLHEPPEPAVRVPTTTSAAASKIAAANARRATSPAARATSQGGAPVVASPRMESRGVTIGAAYLARKEPAKLPWILAAVLGVAVIALVAYIVMK